MSGQNRVNEDGLPDDLEAFTDAQREALLSMTPAEVGQWLGLSEQGGELAQEAIREMQAQEEES